MPASPFCHTHYESWRRAGRPDPGEFAAARADPGPGCEWIDVRCLPRRLRLEIQYALQCRGDERQAPLRPARVQRILRDLAATGAISLLDRAEEEWSGFGPGDINAAAAASSSWMPRPHRAAGLRQRLGRGYPRDKWRLRNLGVQTGKTATVDFAPVSQPWLAALAKRWCRWRLSAGLSAGHAGQGIRALRRFSAFLAAHAPGVTARHPSAARCWNATWPTCPPASARPAPGACLGAERIPPGRPRHGWDDGTLPAAAVFYPEDYPKIGQRLPRAVAGHIMAQVEDPANLDQWGNPSYRLITLILIRCGLRITDACKVPADCVVTDADGAPYLRYYNHKMRREALVPIDDELARQIAPSGSGPLNAGPAGPPCCSPGRKRTCPGPGPSAAAPTGERCMPGWRPATSATSTGSPCT